MKTPILSTAVLLAALSSVPAVAQTTPDTTTKQGNSLHHPADASKQPTQSMAHAPTKQAAQSFSHANPASGDTEGKQH